MADGDDDELETIDVAPAPTAWAPPQAWPPVSTTPPPPSPTPWLPPGPPPDDHSSKTGWIVGIIALMVVAGLLSFAITYNARSDSSNRSANGVPTPSTLPGRIGAPAALGQISLRQGDVVNGVTVGMITNGDQLTRPTLDLCNGRFTTEALRTARLQVAALAATGNAPLSTEAVQYRSADAGAKAMAELQEVRAKCPSKAVVSPVGEPTVVTKFNATPDANWGHTPNVQRLAYDITATNPDTGQSFHSVVVYLRRGRVLMGVYFSRPDGPQSYFSGKASVGDIVGVFESRIASLSDSAVNG